MKDSAERKWFVLYTRPRNEKAVARDLAASGLESYCPLIRSKTRWSDRWKWVEKPLFSSYCFVRLTDQERDQAFGIQGVVRYLYWNGKPAVARNEEIERLRMWLDQYDGDQLSVITFAPGENVKVGSGPLMAMQGTVENKSGNFLYLKMESIGTVVRVDLRKNILEKV